MAYDNVRKELNDYYFGELPSIAQSIKDEVFAHMDAYAAKHPDQNAYELKCEQYGAIAQSVRLRLFPSLPFFFETGALVAHCDGKFSRGGIHANGWLYLHNEHIFRDLDPYGYDLYKTQIANDMYTQCGTFSDMMHQGIPLKKLFKIGLKGILKELSEAQKTCKTDTERDFVRLATTGINTLCSLAQGFADLARKEGRDDIAALAQRVPYNPPQTVHEGLCTLAFMRKNLGSLEGMGFSSFGRVDVLMGELYDSDIKRGVKKEELLDLVTKFLLIWDCTMNRSVTLTGAEYELENTLTLGGCDENGNPVYNGITELFITARDNESILYPKMMLRFSKSSTKEYLEKVSSSLVSSRGFSLYANDETIIPALISSGVSKEDARSYAVGGCWDIVIPDVCLHNGGEYFSLATPLIWSIYDMKDKMDATRIYFESLEYAESFDELYARYLAGIRRIAASKAQIQSRGARVWDRVNPCGALSALMEPCVPSRKDVTAGSGKYNSETAFFTHFAETVNSLLAIKYHCFENKEFTVSELFCECRRDFPSEDFRRKVLSAPTYGDGSEYSSKFVGELIKDLHGLFYDLPTAWGGHIRLGSNYYTEIVNLREKTPSMPCARRPGDFLSQGFTPLRTGKDGSIFDIFDSLRYVDTSLLAASNSITLTLPSDGMTVEKAVQFFRIAANSGVMSVQPNCLKREELIAAMKEPEKYGHIIVRVCGFSAPFVILPQIFKEEIISRTQSEV